MLNFFAKTVKLFCNDHQLQKLVKFLGLIVSFFEEVTFNFLSVC